MEDSIASTDTVYQLFENEKSDSICYIVVLSVQMHRINCLKMNNPTAYVLISVTAEAEGKVWEGKWNRKWKFFNNSNY
jgi:hypothetical protein